MAEVEDGSRDDEEYSADLEGEVEHAEPSPEELTQNYLRLLKHGKLSGSPGRPGTRAGGLQPIVLPPGPVSRGSSAAGNQFVGAENMESMRTVFRAEQERLRQRIEALPVQPLACSNGTPRSGSSQHATRPFTHQSWSKRVIQDHGLPHYRPPPSPSPLPPPDYAATHPPQHSPALSVHARSRHSRSRSSQSSYSSSSFSAPPPSTSSQSNASLLSALKIRTKTCPGLPIYSPGPGAYSPPTDRYGTMGTQNKPKAVFGQAPQRPENICASATGSDTVVSPGPAYLPGKLDRVAGRPVSPRFSFGKKEVGTRSDLRAGHPKNAPLWNPGPGDYEVRRLANGVYAETGVDSPKPTFGASPKLMTAQVNFSATPYVSEGHSWKENAGVHSPGPARYSQDSAPTHTSTPHYTISKKAPSYFDELLDPTRQASPGPVYDVTINQKADRPWTSRSALFGKSSKFWDPELNLSAAPFISYVHAHHANKGIHAPGVGTYRPKAVHRRVRNTHLNSGPADRFYDRFEQGRLG